MNSFKSGLILGALMINSLVLLAQEKDLGDKEYFVVKDYKPVLAESVKISDSPEADTSSSTAPALSYNIQPKKIETNFEAGVIKAVKLKDEPITKLYRSLVKLGIGNYGTTYGDLFVNSLRSKTGSLGLRLHHFSASPHLADVGDAGFSRNSANVYGSYFLENASIYGDLSYDIHKVHYYGFESNDPTINLIYSNPQRFNDFSVNIGMKNNKPGQKSLGYDFGFLVNTLHDYFDVTENEFMVYGKAGKTVRKSYYSLNGSFDYFHKSMASFEKLNLLSDLDRYIVNIQPQVDIEQEKVKLVFGLGLALEENLSATLHAFPKAEITIPVAEHILTAYAGVDGNMEKNNFKTVTDENPFITSAVQPFNTVNKLIIRGGLKGNFSNTITFNAGVKYSQVKDLQLFYNDTVGINRFNVLYDDADVLNIHVEVAYYQGEKLNLSLHIDQYSYTMETQEKAWHKPNSVVALVAKYNLSNKILADFSVFAHGPQYAREFQGIYPVAVKVKGYVDVNLGMEYRYSKILSFYAHLNNLGFTKYYTWNRYPSEQFNLLAGLTYAF